MYLSTTASRLLPLLLLSICLPLTAFAAPEPTPGSISGGLNAIRSDIVTPGGLTNQPQVTIVIARILGWVLGLVAFLALAAIIWGGIMYIVGFGNDERTKKAKTIILSAIIGLAIIGSSFLILRIVQRLFAAT